MFDGQIHQFDPFYGVVKAVNICQLKNLCDSICIDKYAAMSRNATL